MQLNEKSNGKLGRDDDVQICSLHKLDLYCLNVKAFQVQKDIADFFLAPEVKAVLPTSTLSACDWTSSLDTLNNVKASISCLICTEY